MRLKIEFDSLVFSNYHLLLDKMRKTRCPLLKLPYGGAGWEPRRAGESVAFRPVSESPGLPLRSKKKKGPVGKQGS